jgi:hypothetical protein
MNLIDIDDRKYSSVIEINDIGVVTTAVLNNCEVLSTNKDPKYPPRVSFLFKKTAKMEELINRYFKGELLVEPKLFLATLRDIKSRTKIPY